MIRSGTRAAIIALVICFIIGQLVAVIGFIGTYEMLTWLVLTSGIVAAAWVRGSRAGRQRSGNHP
jgi:hypothetical protein